MIEQSIKKAIAIDPDPMLDPNERDLENPFESLANTMACDPRDWSLNGRDAWMWGIIHGWDHKTTNR